MIPLRFKQFITFRISVPTNLKISTFYSTVFGSKRSNTSYQYVFSVCNYLYKGIVQNKDWARGPVDTWTRGPVDCSFLNTKKAPQNSIWIRFSYDVTCRIPTRFYYIFSEFCLKTRCFRCRQVSLINNWNLCGIKEVK